MVHVWKLVHQVSHLRSQHHVSCSCCCCSCPHVAVVAVVAGREAGTLCLRVHGAWCEMFKHHQRSLQLSLISWYMRLEQVETGTLGFTGVLCDVWVWMEHLYYA